MFFNGWPDLLRVVIVGSMAYAAIVILLRVSGKRTLSKMNAFDFIVTVALGSVLATVLLSKEVALAEGVAAFALLIGLQFAITWLSVRVKWIENLVKGEPSLLFSNGDYLNDSLRRERVTKEEVRSAVRGQGIGQMDSVAAVILETDGSMSVLEKPDNGEITTLVSNGRD